jgi:peptidyl-prolyl cis-trans isomerase A (cyclophilin A)
MPELNMVTSHAHRRTALLAVWLLLATLVAGHAPMTVMAATGAADAAQVGPPLVRFDTDAGAIDIELDPERAPQTVENFLDLVDSGFYDGLIFHRVVANFVIQTGGYDRDMQPREPPRTVPNEARNRLKNRRGTVAMARLDDPDSADSQFFINVNNNTHLDHGPDQPGYTVFGRVVAGLDTAVVAIELSETGIRNGMAGVPVTPIVIRKASRIR